MASTCNNLYVPGKGNLNKIICDLEKPFLQ